MPKKMKPWRRKAKKFYPIHASPFYKLQSKKKLAQTLHTSIISLKGMSDKSISHYEYWIGKKPDGSPRPLCRPHQGLDKIQSRIAYLLSCLKTPEYVHAPIAKKSYVTNGKSHVGSKAYYLMDIENFYGSCREEKVLAFFKNKMKCSIDVSVILARICCDKGALPQGSSSSPILSYWAYSDMWNAIYEVCKNSNNTFTLYIDDLTISGDQILGKTTCKIRQIIKKHGLSIKKTKTRYIYNNPAPVTGSIVTQKELRLPNKQHQKLAKAKSEFSKPGGDRKKKLNILRGREAQKKQVIS